MGRQATHLGHADTAMPRCFVSRSGLSPRCFEALLRLVSGSRAFRGAKNSLRRRSVSDRERCISSNGLDHSGVATGTSLRQTSYTVSLTRAVTNPNSAPSASRSS